MSLGPDVAQVAAGYHVFTGMPLEGRIRILKNSQGHRPGCHDAAGSPVAFLAVGAHCYRTMGDKSPKAMRKHADQKQAKINEGNRQKQAAVAAKQVTKKK